MTDPRLAPFVRLQQRGAASTVVIEGELAVHRALRAGAPIHTIVCTSSHARRLPEHHDADVVRMSKEALSQLVGFSFHRGVLAAMERPAAEPDLAILERPRCTIVVLAGLADPANVGAIVRSARAFGADLVLSDTDPWTRKAIRASAGHVFELPVCHVPAVSPWLRQLADATTVIATTPDSSAVDLRCVEPPSRATLVVGGEGQGLPSELLELAALRVRIPVNEGVDSLNAATAAAIFLWQLGVRAWHPRQP